MNNRSRSGLKLELRSRSDYSYEKLIFDPNEREPVFPLRRMERAQGLPVSFQGDKPYCVPCSVIFIANWLGKSSHVPTVEGFVQGMLEGLQPKGFAVSTVLDRAKKLGLIDTYSYLTNPNDQSILNAALASTPLMVGLWNWPLVPDQGHAMVLLDRLANGDFLCINFANPKETDFVTLPSDTRFVFAVSFATSKHQKDGTMPFVRGLSFLENLARNILLLWLGLTRR